MPPFRNPFSTRKPTAADGLEPVNDENAQPPSNGTSVADGPPPKASVALNIKGNRDEPNEFKLSSVNDSGVYLPPSPTEKKSFWHKSSHSSQSSAHRSRINEHEAFTISRESFESYRRSFDISGRSPVLSGAEGHPSRTSLDSRAARLPRSAVNTHTFEKPGATAEEGFEDIGLNDETKSKKRSFLSRFGETASDHPGGSTEPTAPAHHSFHIPGITGRKRGQSGKGAELGNIERPLSKGKGDGVIR